LPRRADLDTHPRVQLAHRLRTHVEVYGDERGFVTLANGLAGRRELSIEVPSDRQGRGVGRALLGDALGLVAAGEPVFAAVAPGNARSLRAFLALGFIPLGCELVLERRAGAEREP
jgi:GNAT superfamily N-acetyltransferase